MEIDFYSLREELDEQLKNCDPFFQEKEHRILVHFYVYYVCQKRLGKGKYNCRVTPTPKGDIIIDIISKRKRLDPIVITKRKIMRHSKEYDLLD